MSDNADWYSSAAEGVVYYDGGVQAGAPIKRTRARQCVISCSSLAPHPARFFKMALVVKHGQRSFRHIRCPVCHRKHVTVVFQGSDDD